MIAGMSCPKAMAQGYGILFDEMEVTADNAADIFGDGMATYDVELNQLMLKDGFLYKQSKNFVTIETGREFHIFLDGTAEFNASIVCNDALFVESPNTGTLTITSNISGSALDCKALFITKDVTLNLLSRNSANDMHALRCDFLSVEFGKLIAEVTTARLAVAVNEMRLEGSILTKPRGGNINPFEGGICYADGIPAKIVHILVGDDHGVDELTDAPCNMAKKVFENGQIVIIKNGKKYAITGQEIR